MSFKPSPQQQAFFDFVVSSVRNAFLEAVAGAGKTTTILEACALLSGFRVAFAAFNKKIADEIEAKAKAKGYNVTVGTFHSYGFRAWREANRRCQVDERGKWKYLLGPVPEELHSFVKQIVSLAKNRALGVYGNICDHKEWWDIIDHFSLCDELPEDADVEVAINFAIDALRESNRIGREVIDFDDMLYLPLLNNTRLPKFDFLLVDEAQDTNPARREFARRMIAEAGRVVFVGDRCQPLGTKVSVVRSEGNRWAACQIEQVNIEDLRVGDRVVSYATASSAFMQRGKRIKGITRRPYAGQMIVATSTDNKVSRYTPNHHCYVSFEGLRDKYAVYLMRRGSQYRVGKCRMDYTHSSGLSARMHHEQADAVWILELCDTEAEAFFHEQAIAGRFGLPQLMFSAKKMLRGPAAQYLPEAWAFIGDNSVRGETCLEFYGRDVRYPLFTRGTGKHQTIKRPMVVHAANLVTGVKMLPYNDKAHVRKSDWVPVTITREHYEGDVVSLDVEDTHLYVADGLLTHNCQAIYGFCGADNDAVDQIIRDFDCVALPLTVTYRCPKKVVEVAQRYVSHIQAHESAPEGTVEWLDAEAFTKRHTSLKVGDAVLCRTTKPLVELAYRLIRQGVPCHVEGRNIGAGLESLLNKWKRCKTVDQFLRKLEEWEEKEVARYMEKDKEVQAEAVKDKAETLRVICEGCELLDDVRARIKSLFTDTKVGDTPRTVILSTVHKAKGREWDTVYVIEFDRMPSKFAKKEWEMEQELNIIYVALTRSKNTLVLVNSIPKE